jgi:hypothetical protein
MNIAILRRLSQYSHKMRRRILDRIRDERARIAGAAANIRGMALLLAIHEEEKEKLGALASAGVRLDSVNWTRQ